MGRVTGSRQSTDHKLHQPPSVPPLCLKLRFFNNCEIIQKHSLALHYLPTVFAWSPRLLASLACPPKLECGGGVPLTLPVWASHCVFCIPQPSSCFLRSWSVFVHYCEVKSQCHFLRKSFLSAPNVCCNTVWKDSTQWHKGGPDHSNLPANTTATASHHLSNNVDRVSS